MINTPIRTEYIISIGTPNIIKPRMNPNYIPIPQKRGIGFLWTLRASGIYNAPTWIAIFLTIGVKHETKAKVVNTIKHKRVI